jgi:FkbM family methyltransferase
LILRIKLLLPERLWRVMTRPAAMLLRALPEKLLYARGLEARRRRRPYSLIGPGDVVFQIGAPADLLAVGRSRSAYFMQLVSGNGKLVVMEPDSRNCEKLQAFARRNGYSGHVIVVNKGAWSEEKTLRFYESKDHPASAVLVELSQATPEEMKRRGYRETPVPVTTVDSVLAAYGLKTPKLVSITTNGAELEILNGMKGMLAQDAEMYISLAVTGDRYREKMDQMGFEYVCDDDRGFTFRKSPRGADQARPSAFQPG